MNPTKLISKTTSLFIFLIILTACSPYPKTPEGTFQDIEITNIIENSQDVGLITQTKLFDQCNSPNPMKAQIQFNETPKEELVLNANVSINAEYYLQGGIEERFALINTTANDYQVIVTIEIPADTRLEYTITWKEIRQNGTIEYIENGEIKSARYSYRVGLELAGSTAKVILCSTNSVPTATLPEFPWPPPNYSASAIINFDNFNNYGTFADVDWIISNALAKGGYDEKSYFSVPNGFAIATRLEQIDQYGYPTNSNRWASELTPISLKNFSLADYLDALFRAPKGHYRIFVFIVTSNVVVSSGTPVSQADAQAWVVEGANKLPLWMKSLPYTKEHTCSVYIYEFVQSGVGEKANQNIPSNITGKEHLERAGIWDTLEK